MTAVPVSGGELAVRTHAGSTEPVLAIHGVSSNCRLWNWVRADSPDLSLIAPDLRGRAASASVAGTSSVDQHVADMIAVLDHAGVERATVCGMSMGAFVAVALATAHPDRVRGAVLVDGGLPVDRDMTEEQIRAAFSAAQADLAQHHFPTPEDYAEHLAPALPLVDRTDPLLLDHLGHDLADGRVQHDAEAIVDDAVDTLLGPSRWKELSRPARLVFAEWSVGEGSAPAYTSEAVAEFAAELPHLQHTELIPGTDHASTIMTPRGAAVVADNIRAALES